MTVKLLMDHMSQPSRAVHLFLLETGIPFTIEQKLLAKGEHVSKEMKKLNPNMQLPTLVDGDFSIYESHAIMKYLQRAYPGYVADHWYPADVRLRARVDAMLDWHHNNLRRGAAGLIFATLLVKVRRPSATAEDQAHLKKEATFNLKNALKRLNDDYCTMGPFLHGMPDITIADLSSAQELVMLDLVGFDYLTDYPNVRAWLERVKSRTQKNWSITNAALDKIVAKNRAKASATGAHMNGQLTTNKTAGNGNASGPWSANGNALQSGAIMTEIQSQLSGPEGAEAIKKLQATFKFIIGDPAQGGACWLLDLKNGGVKELTGDEITSTKADSTFSLSDANFVSLATGKLNPQVAFLGGKLKLHGNLAKAMAFNSNVFQKPTIKAKLVEATSKIIKAKL